MSASTESANGRVLLVGGHGLLTLDDILTSTDQFDYEVDSARDGHAGMAQAEQASAALRPYAVIFVGGQFDTPDGCIQIIEHLWHIDPHVQIVVCDQIVTALARCDHRLLMLSSPFEPTQVLQLTCALTAKSDMTRRAALHDDEIKRLVEQHTCDLRKSSLQLSDQIQRRSAAEARLSHESMHDALTGLPNRNLVHDRIDRCIARAKRTPNYCFAALQMDLDGFTVVNNSLGHEAGNALLVAAAKRLGDCLRSPDTLARLGADEFVILLEEVGTPDQAEVVVKRIEALMAQPLIVGEHEIVTSVSIGIVTNGNAYSEPDDLLRDTDTALRRAKEQGKASCVVFDESMRDRIVARMAAETDLRKALVQNELFLAYQPIIYLQGGDIWGFEALVRWRHPRRGVIMPGQFIAMAEESGLIQPLGRWVLQEACRQVRQWNLAYPHARGLCVSVNLSCKQFTDPMLLAFIDEVLSETQLDPSQLKLEITESVLAEPTEATAAMLAGLKERHLDLLLDDFGTGYSSLSLLNQLPIDVLKVDRSFVQQMTAGQRNATVEAVITLAHNHGMQVIGEGVETAEQMTQLLALNCDLAQGYLFARPAEASAVVEMVAEGRCWRASA